MMVLRMNAMVMIMTLTYIKDIRSTEKILLFPQRTPHQPGCLSVCLFIKPDLSNDDDDGGGDDDNDDGDCRRIYFDPII